MFTCLVIKTLFMATEQFLTVEIESDMDNDIGKIVCNIKDKEISVKQIKILYIIYIIYSSITYNIFMLKRYLLFMI